MDNYFMNDLYRSYMNPQDYYRVYEKYSGFIDNFNAVGKSIESAMKTYNNARGQLTDGRGNMSRLFDRIKEKSGITTNKKIALEYKDE